MVRLWTESALLIEWVTVIAGLTLMVTSSDEPGSFPVLQLVAVSQSPLPPTQLTADNRDRTSRPSTEGRRAPARLGSARRRHREEDRPISLCRSVRFMVNSPVSRVVTMWIWDARGEAIGRGGGPGPLDEDSDHYPVCVQIPRNGEGAGPEPPGRDVESSLGGTSRRPKSGGNFGSARIL
jgi:hypothetical protein